MRDEKLYSVNTIPLEYKRLFGRDIEIFDVIEMLPIVLRASHGVPPDHIFISTKVEDCKVILPCVYYSVRYVTTPYSESDYDLNRIITSGQGILFNYDMDSWRGSISEANGDVIINEEKCPAVKVNKNFPLKPTGQYVNYRTKGNVMEFENSGMQVNILLTVMPLDEKGYPMVTEQVITAMSYFLNLVDVQKRYYAGKAPRYIFVDAKEDYEQKLGEAMSPHVLSDNEINDIMNTLSSFHRHQYNTPFRY